MNLYIKINTLKTSAKQWSDAVAAGDLINNKICTSLLKTRTHSRWQTTYK